MSTSIMATEAGSAPSVVQTLIANNEAVCQQLADKFKADAPRAIMMIGRGTSDHAGVFAKYLFEVGCGIPVISAAPSVAGVFNTTLKLDGCLAIAISQSGKSPDIVHQLKLAKAGGAFSVAIVNDATSELASLADVVLPLHAGPEKAVAATKSYLASLASLCQLFSVWSENKSLHEGLKTLGKEMQKACEDSPKLTVDSVKDVAHCVVLGRGFGYAIAREIALKLKEVLGIHAEAFSSAEFLHGPVTLLEKKMLVLNIALNDETKTYHQNQIDDVVKRGGRVVNLSLGEDCHPRLQPLIIMQRFYLDIEQIAQQMGLDPDTPPGLKKVTETV